MYLKLTNAIKEHDGNIIAIRKDAIISVREGDKVSDSGIPELVTFVFCPPHGTWEVKEDVDTVLDMLNEEVSKKTKKTGKVELLNEKSK